MKFIRQNFWTPGCLRCGTFAVHRSLFCEVCWNDKLQKKIGWVQSSIEHYYLFGWGESDPKYFDQLVYCLKSKLSINALEFYAELLFDTCSTEICLSEYCAIVPIPGSRKASVHSEIIARRISELSSIPLALELLKNESPIEQKRLNLNQRKTTSPFKLNIQKLEEFTKSIGTDPLIDRKYLFVDDVLTSGSSYKQCSALLNSRGAGSILTLFYRRREHR